MRDSRWREGKRRGRRRGETGGRDTVEEKKSSSQLAIQEQEGGARTRPHHTHAHAPTTPHTTPSLTPHTHTHLHMLTHPLDCTQYAVHTRTPPGTAPLPARPRGAGGKREGGRGKGPPGSGPLYADWTRIGCRAGKGRLLSVLTDPTALVPDRGGTVDQSHAPACRSTAHLGLQPTCTPTLSARLPAYPATRPADLQTCNLMPSQASLCVSERQGDQLDCAAERRYSTATETYSGLYPFSCFPFYLLPSPPLPVMSVRLSVCQPMHPTKDLTSSKLFASRLATNARPDTSKRTDGGG